MARFEWLTPERVMKSVGVLAGLVLFGGGILNLYLGLVFPDEFRLFGVDALLVAGGLQVVAGILFLIKEYEFRPPA